MMTSELIAKLGEAYLKHGDMPVLLSVPFDTQQEISTVVIDNKHIILGSLFQPGKLVPAAVRGKLLHVDE